LGAPALFRRAALLLGLLAPLLVDSTNVSFAQSEKAQRSTAAQQQTLRTKINESSLLVLASSPAASYLSIARDIGTIAGSDLRVMAMTSGGGMDNLSDLLFLRGADMAIVASNVLVKASSTDILGPGLQQRLAYVTRLHGEEVHILVGQEVKSIGDLRGKKVAVAAGDGNALFTSGDLFQRLGTGIEAVPMNAATGVDQLRSGEVSALMLIGGKPLAFVAGLPKDGSLRLLDVPFSKAVEDAYAPAVFRADDYPALIPSGATIESVSLTAILMTSSGRGSEDVQRRVARFVPAFFEGLTAQRSADLHPKWREVNLAATMPDWTRVPAAQEWLDKARQSQADVLQMSFEEFLRTNYSGAAASISPEARKKLFEEFVSWARKSVADPNAPTRR
jgi:TRAP-type uncharacterized transport system substrate-binding protein